MWLIIISTIVVIGCIAGIVFITLTNRKMLQSVERKRQLDNIIDNMQNGRKKKQLDDIIDNM